MGIFNKKNKKSELSEEQAKKFSQMGEDFVERLKLKERINKINQFGKEKPQVAFGIIFGVLFLSFVIGAFYPRGSSLEQKEYQIQGVSNAAILEKEISTKKELEFEINEILREMEMLSDTMQTILSKEKLTQQDSIFVMEKFTRLEYLESILNSNPQTDEN